MVDLLPTAPTLAPDRGAECASPGPFGLPEDLNYVRSQCSGCESGQLDDVTVVVSALLAQHRQDAVEAPTTTGCPDLHEVGCKKLPEPGLVGSARRCLELALQFEDLIQGLRRRELSHGMNGADHAARQQATSARPTPDSRLRARPPDWGTKPSLNDAMPPRFRRPARGRVGNGTLAGRGDGSPLGTRKGARSSGWADGCAARPPTAGWDTRPDRDTASEARGARSGDRRPVHLGGHDPRPLLTVRDVRHEH